ncbi:MAG: TolC family protein, partial [Deltaproteobacteria bacterium]|nr:TolC family protein [Deltaproteobacteria bacterium]
MASILSVVLPAASYAEAPGAPAGAEVTLIVRQGERLNLSRCIEIAEKMQPNIAFAANNVHAARARVLQAQSGYYPQGDASAGYSRSDPAAEVGAGPSKSSDLYTGSISLKQNIYDFGRTSGQVNAEKYNLESSRSDLENIRNQTAFNVKAAYYGALLAEKNRDVSQEAVKQFQEHLLQAKGFYEVGTKPKIDVTRAEVDLSGAKVGLIKAENSLRIAKINLRNAMGIPEAPLFD